MYEIYESMVSIIFKLKILFKSIKIIKNWYLYPLCYFGLVRSVYICLKTKNLKINLRTHSTDLMAFTNVWLIEEYSKSGFEIKNNDLVIDIGSHIGLFTLFSSQFCKNGKILCYEPVKENYDLLSCNIRSNNLENIILFNYAVSKNEQPVKIFLNIDQSGHSMFIPSQDFIEINSISLKKIFDENNVIRCNLLKLDCEGAEYEIMETLPLSYFNKIDKMIIEYHFATSKPNLLQNLIKKLESLSYVVTIKQILPDIGLIYAKKNN